MILHHLATHQVTLTENGHIARGIRASKIYLVSPDEIDYLPTPKQSPSTPITHHNFPSSSFSRLAPEFDATIHHAFLCPSDSMDCSLLKCPWLLTSFWAGSLQSQSKCLVPCQYLEGEHV